MTQVPRKQARSGILVPCTAHEKGGKGGVHQPEGGVHQPEGTAAGGGCTAAAASQRAHSCAARGAGRGSGSPTRGGGAPKASPGGVLVGQLLSIEIECRFLRDLLRDMLGVELTTVAKVEVKVSLDSDTGPAPTNPTN
jgi:hypothetical protein